MYGEDGAPGAGVSYEAAGDVTGDGIVDLFAQDWHDPVVAWILPGGVSLPFDADVEDAATGTIASPGGGEVSAEPIGDLDADGIDDFTVYAFGAADSEVHVFFGGDDFEGTIRPRDAQLVVTGDSVLGAGRIDDLDGDGLSELLVTTYETTSPGEYDLVLVQGRTTWPDEVTWDADAVIATGRTGFNAFVAVGDLNGDGCGDLVLPDVDADVGKIQDAGAIDVWLGRTDWPSSLGAADVDVRFEGNSYRQNLGRNALIMDLDGDDYDDIVTPTLEVVGTTYIFFGQP